MLLPDLQRWTQECITHAAPLPEVKIAQAQKLVKPSATLQPEERVEIYRGMYTARLKGALKIDYPVLSHLLGEDLFDQLAELYLQAHPSRSYTLNRLGDHLPSFIENVEGIPCPGFAVDVARLELIETQVFDEQESERQALPSLVGMAGEEMEAIRFEPVRACRLAEFRYPMHRYFAAYREGKPIRRPRPAATHLLITRQNFQLRHHPVMAPAQPILACLLAGGSLGEALEAGRHLHPRTIQNCFADWFAAGIFARILPTG